LKARRHIALAALVALALPLAGHAQRSETPKLYRWVDDKGVVHYGDSIPPQYANRDRNVLNNQGVRVGFEEGEITPEERAALAAREAEAAAQAAAKAEAAQRDRVLLDTYLTVQDIEDLRNRRIELLESQIKVTELYLTNLRKRLVTLQDEASNYRPYTAREGAPQVPANLALDISRTTASINLYEETLSRTRSDQATLRTAFDNDIARFRELKGG
jgi:hypothetical protein